MLAGLLSAVRSPERIEFLLQSLPDESPTWDLVESCRHGRAHHHQMTDHVDSQTVVGQLAIEPSVPVHPVHASQSHCRLESFRPPQ